MLVVLALGRLVSMAAFLEDTWAGRMVEEDRGIVGDSWVVGDTGIVVGDTEIVVEDRDIVEG